MPIYEYECSGCRQLTRSPCGDIDDVDSPAAASPSFVDDRIARRRPGVPAKSGARVLQRRIDAGIELNDVELDVDWAWVRQPLSVTRPAYRNAIRTRNGDDSLHVASIKPRDVDGPIRFCTRIESDALSIR